MALGLRQGSASSLAGFVGSAALPRRPTAQPGRFFRPAVAAERATGRNPKIQGPRPSQELGPSCSTCRHWPIYVPSLTLSLPRLGILSASADGCPYRFFQPSHASGSQWVTWVTTSSLDAITLAPRLAPAALRATTIAIIQPAALLLRVVALLALAQILLLHAVGRTPRHAKIRRPMLRCLCTRYWLPATAC